MQITSNISELNNIVSAWKQEGEKIVFVPTMGNLHQGHLDLVKAAQEMGGKVVVSIFVNPMQFGESEDFAEYPRTLDDDARKLIDLKADLLFTPKQQDIYPDGKANMTKVVVTGLSEILCGLSRPQFFLGVATVVTKLFNLVSPDIAVFGKKDFQQQLIIKQLVKDLNMPVSIVSIATRRENDGLAMSSRNGYLTEAQRAVAPMLYKALEDVAESIRLGNHDYPGLQKSVSDKLTQAGFVIDYVEIRNAKNLMPADALLAQKGQHLVVLLAVKLGATRLIDNVEICL